MAHFGIRRSGQNQPNSSELKNCQQNPETYVLSRQHNLNSHLSLGALFT
jgi:hypothetical protein